MPRDSFLRNHYFSTMNMYCTESPISSDEENETSRTRWSNQHKLYECTRCGYVSERKCNVQRHFRRIHCELKRHKTCICDKTFKTKGEYYEHCDNEHPRLRHKRYITTEKYKIGKLKSKAKTSTVIDSSCQEFKSNKKNLRSSSRLQLLYDKAISKSEEMAIMDLSSNLSSKEVSESESDKENQSTNSERNTDKMHEDINLNTATVFEQQVSVFDMNLPLTHLPLKKRFGNFSKRKCLSDLTNFNKARCSGNAQAMPNDIDALHRAFISQIDFDELDGILNLKYLKEPIH